MAKLKFKSNIFKSFNTSVVHTFLYNVFNKYFIIFYIYIYKCLKIYQPNIIKKIKKTTKKARERYQNLSKEEKKKSSNMVENVTKISQKMKNKSLLSIEKNVLE